MHAARPPRGRAGRPSRRRDEPGCGTGPPVPRGRGPGRPARPGWRASRTAGTRRAAGRRRPEAASSPAASRRCRPRPARGSTARREATVRPVAAVSPSTGGDPMSVRRSGDSDPLPHQRLRDPQPHRARHRADSHAPADRDDRPRPVGSNGSGPARSSRRSPGPNARPPSGAGGRSAAVEESMPSRARRIRKVQMPHSTGVNWSRLSAKARSKPSRRSTTACARAFSIPIASRVAQPRGGQVRDHAGAIQARGAPEDLRAIHGDRAAAADFQPFQGRGEPAVAGPARQPALAAGPGAPRAAAASRTAQRPAPGRPRRPRPASSRLPTRSSRAFRGSTDFVPALRNPRSSAPVFAHPSRLSRSRAVFKTSDETIFLPGEAAQVRAERPGGLNQEDHPDHNQARYGHKRGICPCRCDG